MKAVPNVNKRSLTLEGVLIILVIMGALVISAYFSSHSNPVLSESAFSNNEREEIQIERIYTDESVKSDTTLSSQWDTNNNSFDLVSGVLTIQLAIDEISESELLSQSKGFTELLVASNSETEISTIELEIKSGENKYFFDSAKPTMIAKTK